MRTLYKLFLSAVPLLLGSLAAVQTQAQTPQYFFQSATSVSNGFPLSTAASNKVQWVYQPNVHFPTAPSGLITKVYFKTTSAVASTTFTNLTIKLGADTLTQFPTGVQPWVGNLTTVYSAPTTTFTGLAAGDWFSVVLPTPYLFNASQSLIVEMSQTAYTSGVSLPQESVTGIMPRLYGSAAGTTGTAATGRAHFGFDWLPACAVPTAFSDAAATTSAAFGWTASTSTNVGYEFTYGTSATTPTGAGTPTASTSVSISGLAPNTTYYYFVRTVCGPSEYSAYVGDSFKTCNPPATSFIAVGSPFPASAAICEGDTAVLKAPGGTGYTYLFLLNGAVTGTGTTSDSVLRTMQGGSYRVVVANAAGCSDTSAAAGVTVTVNPLPAPNVTLSGANLLSTGLFSSYQWRLNGNPINLATQQIYTASASGAYSVTVTNAAGCRATSNPYSLVVTTVGDAARGAAIRVFPNPTTGRIVIESSVPVTAQVWGVDGRKLMQVENASGIDLTDFASGVYMLRLTERDGTVLTTERLTKAN